MSLNGMWKFNWVPTSQERPLDFYQTDFNDAAWNGFIDILIIIHQMPISQKLILFFFFGKLTGNSVKHRIDFIFVPFRKFRNIIAVEF